MVAKRSIRVFHLRTHPKFQAEAPLWYNQYILIADSERYQLSAGTEARNARCLPAEVISSLKFAPL